MERHTLNFWDYIVLLLTLLISLGIGIYFRFSGGRQKTTKEYLHGDREQSVLPVALSLMASFMSAITLLGVTAEVYSYGTLFLTIIGSYILFTWVAAYFYLPVFFKLQTTSAYEYLEKRFGSEVRLAASLIYSLQMLLYMGVVLYAPTVALETLTGLSHNWSILVVGIVCTIYSTMGGIKAIIWTDVFQSLLMYAALFSVIGVAIWTHGGVMPIWNIAQENGRIQFFDFTFDPTVRHSTWSLFIGGGFTFLSLYAVNQTQVQRYLTMPDYKTAIRSLWLSLPFLYLLLIACGFAGLSILSVYSQCDPFKLRRICKPDELMPLFVMDWMGSVPGLLGLFAAGIISASLSTVSACVNSLATVTIEDYFKPLYTVLPVLKLGDSVAVMKLLVFTYGLACMGVAFLAQLMGGLLQAGLSVLGVAGGPLLGIFTLGMFLPSANTPGALAGMLSGLVTAVWIGFGQPKPRPIPLPLSTEGCLHTFATNITFCGPVHPSTTQIPYMYRVSYLLYVVISCFTTIGIGIFVSWVATYRGYQLSGEINPDLFTPLVARYLRQKHKPINDEIDLQKQMLSKDQERADMTSV